MFVSIQSPPGTIRNHPEPTRKQQQASGFLVVAKFSHSEIIPVKIVPRQTYPSPLCMSCVLSVFLASS